MSPPSQLSKVHTRTRQGWLTSYSYLTIHRAAVPPECVLNEDCLCRNPAWLGRMPINHSTAEFILNAFHSTRGSLFCSACALPCRHWLNSNNDIAALTESRSWGDRLCRMNNWHGRSVALWWVILYGIGSSAHTDKAWFTERRLQSCCNTKTPMR